MNDIDYMTLALEQAQKSLALREVPVGAVLVKQGEVIAQGYNQPISMNDPTAHAEVMALRQAAKREQNYRLVDTTLYVTLEPCLMCFGALLHARVARVVFGAHDAKCGVLHAQDQLPDQWQFNHRLTWEGGVLATACAELLKNFFKGKR